MSAEGKCDALPKEEGNALLSSNVSAEEKCDALPKEEGKLVLLERKALGFTLLKLEALTVAPSWIDLCAY